MLKFGIFLAFFALGIKNTSVAQSDYWVTFKDKGNFCKEYLANPEIFLSKAAINRRLIQKIVLDETDLPIYSDYLNKIRSCGGKIVICSKWLNGALVKGDSLSLTQLAGVQSVTAFKEYPAQNTTCTFNTSGIQFVSNSEARFQLEQLNLTALHQAAFDGRGVRVGIFDSGFRNVKNNRGFAKIGQTNRWLGQFDFVDNDTALTQMNDDVHGAFCLSIIAGYIDNEFSGSCPGASFFLARTENVAFERRVEELYWLRAAEFADSLGIDVISSSLNYNIFDPNEGNYAITDLNGRTAIITNAARLAARKGIVVVTSAGNEGNSSWRFITPPADADSILSVGAVQRDGLRASLSGIGPTTDGRFKPDVVALGVSTNYINTSGLISSGNGTSYSAPLVAGLVACLKQKHPNASAQQLIQAIRSSASQAQTPDNALGFGIPNALKADSILCQLPKPNTKEACQPLKKLPAVFPNPVNDTFWISMPNLNNLSYKIEIMDMIGRVVWFKETHVTHSPIPIDVSRLVSGQYLVKISQETLLHEDWIIIKH